MPCKCVNSLFFFFLFIYLFGEIFFFFVCVLLAIIIKKVHDVFRNYLARMRAFDGSRSLLTLENRSQLTVIFFDWSDKNSCSISYEKWGKTDNLLVTQNLAHNYFILCFSSYLLVTSSDTSAVIGTPSSRVRIVVS